MAGGKGTRMRHPLEKPLIPVGGKAMVERVVSAVQRSKRISRVLVVVTHNTPNTAKRISLTGMADLVTAPGRGYHEDMRYAIKSERVNTALVLSADLPLITPEIIDRVIEEYERSKKPALMVAVRKEFYEQMGFHSNSAYFKEHDSIIPAGINVLNGRMIDEKELDEEVLVMDRVEIAANINSREDLKKLEDLASERTRQTQPEYVEKDRT
jgi:adenosylcobinamide-phosphate guanylyltransferase